MTSPNPYHHAVVVGINVYPGGYTTLNGPVPDADAFVEWLLDPEQGGLPEKNVRRVVTPEPAPTAVATATPTKQAIDLDLWGAHQELKADLAALPEADRAAARDKSRLYFFLAGHGIMPGVSVAALLDATAQRGLSPNLELGAYQRWLEVNGQFAEVVIFADCCRNYSLIVPDGQPGMDTPARVGGRVVSMLGLATAADELSFEEVTTAEEADLRRGFFSKTLIDGLRGNAADPATGLVTTSSLRNYVEPIVESLTKDKPEPQKAVITAPSDLIFGPQRVGVVSDSAPGRESRKVVITFPAGYRDMVELVGPGVVYEWDPADGPWTVRLYDAIWYVQKKGSQQDTTGLKNNGLIEVGGKDRNVDL